MKNFFIYLASIRLADLIDITFISYILFRLYVLFRGTVVLRALIGIVLLLIFQRIASSMNLVLTSWSLQGIIAAAAILLIVIFRNEIRSVLQAKNLKTILWSTHYEDVNTPVDIISESSFALAKKRHGALIVIEAKDNIKDIVHSGLLLNGILSKEMITSIFWPDNPVHDGAAIIKGDKIFQVGAILPVSGRKDLPSIYGTRHRAAAGLAERTDSLVVVVSEETGKVVVVKDGQFKDVRDEKELKKTLEEYSHQAVEEITVHRKRLRFELSIAALVSFLFVTSVWFGFTRGLDTIIAMDIPIEYMNRPPEMEILNTSVNSIHFQLSGSGAILKSIGSDQVQVRIDLSKAVEGENSFTITNENIKLPPGVVLKEMEPNEVDITLDVQVEKELPVQVDWVGKLPYYLILTEVKTVPEKITVKGARGILKNLSTIYTEKVRLDNIEKSGEISVNLTLSPASLKVSSDSGERVKVVYVVEERSFFDIEKHR